MNSLSQKAAFSVGLLVTLLAAYLFGYLIDKKLPLPWVSDDGAQKLLVIASVALVLVRAWGEHFDKQDSAGAFGTGWKLGIKNMAPNFVVILIATHNSGAGASVWMMPAIVILLMLFPLPILANAWFSVMPSATDMAPRWSQLLRCQGGITIAVVLAVYVGSLCFGLTQEQAFFDSAKPLFLPWTTFALLAPFAATTALLHVSKVQAGAIASFIAIAAVGGGWVSYSVLGPDRPKDLLGQMACWFLGSALVAVTAIQGVLQARHPNRMWHLVAWALVLDTIVGLLLTFLADGGSRLGKTLHFSLSSAIAATITAILVRRFLPTEHPGVAKHTTAQGP